MFIDEIKTEFTEHVIPFWEGMKDEEYGGYYGLLDFDLKLDKKAVKGCILNSRILWFFSNAYLCLRKDEYLSYAEHAYSFMMNYCLDKEKGGIFWSVTYDGKPEDDTKHTYNQAFAIYALSSYYDASGNRDALDEAYALFDVIEKKCRDEGGYLEAFNRHFQPTSNEKLSENGVEAGRTMNTLLHVFEAYTELLRVDNSEQVRERLIEILDIFVDKVYNPEIGRLEVFFDKDYNTLIDLYSYGHDIEAAWLIDRGLKVLGDSSYSEKLLPITARLTEEVYKHAYVNGSVPAECCEGVVEQLRIWWVQVESMVGFYNGYQRFPEKEYYLDAVKNIWSFIQDFLIDKREGSEWFSEVDENGVPTTRKEIVEPWKCPYHTGRMCFELLTRSGALQ